MNWIQDNARISNVDLKRVFKYEAKGTTAVSWSNDNNLGFKTLEDSCWEEWLEDESPDRYGPRLARAGQESPCSSIEEKSIVTNDTGGQRKLRTVPFSEDTFRRIIDTFHIHGSISTVVSRADVPVFQNTQVLMKDANGKEHRAHVYNCRTSNEWATDLALTVTHLPDLQRTYCIMFGCDEGTVEMVTHRLSALGTEISYPLIMPAILVELERLRHIDITSRAIASMETKIAELDFNADYMDEEMGCGAAGDRNSARRSTWLDTAHLQNCLINWKYQLEKLRQCVATLEEDNETCSVDSRSTTLGSDQSEEATTSSKTGQKMVDRIKAIEEEYDQRIRDCRMRLEGMSMATQWSRLAAHESNSGDNNSIPSGYILGGRFLDVLFQLEEL
ncbi:hypothetical protein PG988_016154 [Apiospora saccharicola]